TVSSPTPAHLWCSAVCAAVSSRSVADPNRGRACVEPLTFTLAFARGDSHEAFIRRKSVGLLQKPGNALADRQWAPSTICDLEECFFRTPITHVITTIDGANNIQRLVRNGDAFYRFKLIKVVHVADDETRFA